MNVLFLTHNFPRRSGDASGSFVLRLAQALRGEGITAHVVAPAAQNLAAHEAVEGVAVERFHYAPRSLETLAYGGNMAEQVRQSWGARMALVGFLGSEFSCAVRVRRAQQPALVHAHWWFPNGVVGSWLSRMSHLPLVTTLHGTDVRLARSISVSRPAFRHVLKQSAAVTAVSRWLAEEVCQIVAGPEPTVAPMPVATELFAPGGLRSPNRFLFVGRLNKQKGIELLLRALVRLPAAVTLDVIGDGEERARLEALAGELGVAGRVRWQGALPQPRLADFYRQATALVVPSVGEGLGLVAVEAQLCETPVVAFDSGGLRDVIQHDRTGILVPAGDADALGRALEELLARDDRGRALGEAGRLHALSTFAPESVARRYAGIYRDVLAASTQ